MNFHLENELFFPEIRSLFWQEKKWDDFWCKEQDEILYVRLFLQAYPTDARSEAYQHHSHCLMSSHDEKKWFISLARFLFNLFLMTPFFKNLLMHHTKWFIYKEDNIPGEITIVKICIYCLNCLHKCENCTKSLGRWRNYYLLDIFLTTL